LADEDDNCANEAKKNQIHQEFRPIPYSTLGKWSISARKLGALPIVSKMDTILESNGKSGLRPFGFISNA